MRTELDTWTKKLNQLIGQRDLLLSQQEVAEKEAVSFQKTYEDTLKARVVLQQVASDTQKQIEYHISNLVTMALATVFPDPYEFQLRFVQRRNKTEADLIFIKHQGEVDNILENGGGGVADIASSALRFALWSIKKSRATILLDEPTKFLHSPIYQQKAAEMFSMISKKLNVQLIIVSDQKELLSAADKIIEITNIDGESIINESFGEQ